MKYQKVRTSIITIIIHSIILLVALTIFSNAEDSLRHSYSINEFLDENNTLSPSSFIEKYIEWILGVIGLILFSLSFIVLGFYLNFKYENQVRYWEYIIIGSITSILSISIFYLAIKYGESGMTYNYNWSYYLRSVSKHIFFIPLFSFFLITLCAIVALFHKHFKIEYILNLNDK